MRAYGIVRYADTLKQARKIEKLGRNVLIVPTEKVTDDRRGGSSICAVGTIGMLGTQ